MIARYFVSGQADYLKQAMLECCMDPDDDWLQSTIALFQRSNSRFLPEDSLAPAEMLHGLRLQLRIFHRGTRDRENRCLLRYAMKP